MILNHIILHGLFYTFIGTAYLFLFMITFSPRIWGYQDYPDAIKEKVPPQTKKERVIGGIVGIPWFIFILGFPFVSSNILKTQLGGEIPLEIAFLNVFVMVFSFFIIDLVILDWLIIAKITPQFVIIPGTDVEDYKDFSLHYTAHAKAAIVLVFGCLVYATIIVFF